jgi:hypothetical protein
LQGINKVIAMNLVDELKKERTELQRRIDAIDVLLNVYGVVSTNVVAEEKHGVNFPRGGRTDKQILWLFENHFNKAVRMNEINTAYNTYNGTVGESVDNVTRRLKKEDNLVMVKYNGTNKLTFYGLPSWIDDNDFKEQYKPDEDDLPLGEITSEVVGN